MTSDSPPLSQVLRRALDQAQKELEPARQRYAGHGLDPDETCAELARQLSAQELADVHAEAEARLQEIERDARLACAEPPPARALRSHPSSI